MKTTNGKPKIKRATINFVTLFYIIYNMSTT